MKQILNILHIVALSLLIGYLLLWTCGQEAIHAQVLIILANSAFLLSIFCAYGEKINFKKVEMALKRYKWLNYLKNN